MPALLAATLVADRDSNEWVGPGLLAFAVILGLCVGTFLLWRNMNKQIRKVRFDDGSGSDEPGTEPGAESGTGPGTESENGDQPAGSPKQG